MFEGRIQFPWATLNAVIGGRSAIDVPRLHVHTLEEAEEFLESYGYIWSDWKHREELSQLREETMTFFAQEFLPGEEALEIPLYIQSERDIRQWMLWASEKGVSRRQQWCCALLRVMHTLAHSDNYFNRVFGVQIREQILERFSGHIHERADGLFLGKGEEAVPLAYFEIKQAKTRRSVMMKLLHKVENVATDIFDRIGIRLITHDRLDALLVVRYLRLHHVIMFANIKPSRSRNTLIDLDLFKQQLDLLNALQEEGRISLDEQREALRASLEDQGYPNLGNFEAGNRFSSSDYHSIQFTCRQLIRAKALSERPILDPGLALDTIPLRDSLEGNGEREEIRFFFPYEVQIMDKESYARTRSGRASHEEYKKRQREAVKRRVLGPLLWPSSKDKASQTTPSS